MLESSICMSDAIQQQHLACTGPLQKGVALGHTMSHRIAFAEPAGKYTFSAVLNRLCFRCITVCICLKSLLVCSIQISIFMQKLKPSVCTAAAGWQRQLPCHLPATHPQAAADPQKPPDPSPLQTCTTLLKQGLTTLTSVVEAPRLLTALTSCHLFRSCRLFPATLQQLPLLLHLQVLLPHNPRSPVLLALNQQV